MKKVLYAVGRYIRHTDIWLWLLCLAFSSFSAILLAGVVNTELIPGLTFNRVLVQAGAAVLGVIAAILISKVDYHIYTKLWKLHTLIAYTLVLLTFVVGTGTSQRQGDKSWFALPGGMTFQPSELLKISFILTLAYHIYTVRDHINTLSHLMGLCVHGAVPILLIHVQGDDGSAIIFACIFVAMVFAAGINWKYVFAAAVAAVAAAPLIWFFVLSDYQRQRFLILYVSGLASPRGDYYQQYRAALAIGSGQIWGKGIFSGKHSYVPEAHTDFIFAFIGESLGFVGCLAVVCGLIFLCTRILADGHRSRDLQGRLICTGVFAMIAAQAIINIGMCVSMLPVIGITLPFLSAGGSSVAITYLGIGLVLSVYMNTSKSIFD